MPAEIIDAGLPGKPVIAVSPLHHFYYTSQSVNTAVLLPSVADYSCFFADSVP